MHEAPGPTALLGFPSLLAHMPSLAGVRGQGQLALGPVVRGTFGWHGLGLLLQAALVLGGTICILSLPPRTVSAAHTRTSWLIFTWLPAARWGH